MLQFKSANGSRASRRWAKSGKAEHISKEMSSLKVYRASRWSAIGLIGDPRPKTVLDDGRLSHGSVYLPMLRSDCRRLGKSRAGDIWCYR
jgi:hypothetical protein